MKSIGDEFNQIIKLSGTNLIVAHDINLLNIEFFETIKSGIDRIGVNMMVHFWLSCKICYPTAIV